MLIIQGKTYTTATGTGRYFYVGGGRAIAPGQSFVATYADQFDDILKLGMGVGQLVESFADLTSVEARETRKAEIIASMATFVGQTYSSGLSQRRTADAAIEARFALDSAATISVSPVSGDELEVTGTVSMSGKFRVLLNGVIDGAVFTVVAAGAFSHTFVGNPVQGDVVGVQAMLADGVTTSGDPVNVTVLVNDIVLSPVVAGDTVVTFSVGVAGTFQAQINSVDSGSAAAKTVGAGRTLTFGVAPVGGQIVGVYETTAPVSEPVTVTTKFLAPSITAPVVDADTTVVVTSAPAAADGTAVNVYRLGASIGSGVVAGGAGACTVTTGALAPGDSLTATHGAGASLSAASTARIVQFNAATVAAIAPAADVTGTVTAPDGTLVTIFVQQSGVGTFDAVTPTGTVTANAFDITPAVALDATDVVKVKVGPAGATQSEFSNAVVVT